jgi:hypothetical protein
MQCEHNVFLDENAVVFSDPCPVFENCVNLPPDFSTFVFHYLRNEHTQLPMFPMHTLSWNDLLISSQ